jgi:TorA maturation chaperone TorD
VNQATPLHHDAAPTVTPEDQARADLYGVIAQLFYAAPDEQFLAALVSTGVKTPSTAPDSGQGGPLDDAWQALIAASRSAYPVKLENEHTVLFVGTGKAAVTPYLSNYVLRHQSDTPLAELRGWLDARGMARREGVTEYEDHIAGLMETMRYLIAVQHGSLEDQRKFFERYIYDGAVSFCVAVTASEQASFYKFVARFTRIFLDIEKNAFTIG